MSRAINWEHHKRVMKNVNGVNPYSKECGIMKNTSESQYNYIRDLIAFLGKHGIDANWVVQSTKGYKHRPTTAQMIRTLNQIMKDNGLIGDIRIEYLNLCKHRETGKKIKYRTTKFGSAPVGYEFIGQLSKEIMLVETVA